MEKNFVFDLMMNLLSQMKNDPSSVTEEDRNKLDSLYKSLCQATNVSEHSKWAVEWVVEKWNSMKEKMDGIAPYEVLTTGQNIILDSGATAMLKLIIGDSSATAFNNANAKIYVGTDTTPENASQTGILASGANSAYAAMDSTYPVVDNRTVTFRATFGDGAANFAWREAAVTNGTGVGAVAMNRKVFDMGTKKNGTWTMQITISLLSA